MAEPSREAVEALAGGTIGEMARQIMNAYDAWREAMTDQINIADELRGYEVDLEATQDAILLGDHLGGSNAEKRAAQMRGLAERQYLAHRSAEGRYQRARAITTMRYELLKTLRALGSLLSGTSHA